MTGLLGSGCWIAEGVVTGALTSGPSAGALSREPSLLVASTRRAAGNPGERPWFGSERGKGLAFAEAKLTPPDRSLIGRAASVVTGDWAVASVGPVQDSGGAQAFAQAALGRDVLLYVHGYRETFEGAAVNAAELSDGVRFSGATGLFTWRARRTTAPDQCPRPPPEGIDGYLATVGPPAGPTGGRGAESGSFVARQPRAWSARRTGEQTRDHARSLFECPRSRVYTSSELTAAPLRG